jgi:hypothetical protein
MKDNEPAKAMKKDENKVFKELTPLKAIREKCLDCCVGSRAEVRRCNITDCPVFPYRFGHNPNRSGIGAQNGKFGKKAKLNSSFSKEKDQTDKLVNGKPNPEKVVLS